MDSLCFPCCLCFASFATSDKLVSHISIIHSTLTTEKFVCKFGECFREFDRLKSFKKHLLIHKPQSGVGGKAKRIKCDSGQIASTVCEENVVHQEPAIVSVNCDDTCTGGGPEDQVDPGAFFNGINNAVVKMLGDLYSQDSLTRKHVQNIIDCVKELACGTFLDILQDAVVKALEKSNSDQLLNINCLFDIFRGMFDDVDSEHKRLKYFSEQTAFIEPISYSTGVANMQKNVKGQIVLEPVTLTGAFISPAKVLKRFLELPGVYQEICSYMESLDVETDTMENLIQGTLWKDKIKPMFEGKVVLPLNMGYDDFETNKDLGSHAVVHKMGACHITIPCLPPSHQSLLENFFLVALFYASDKHFGLSEVFGVVLHALKELEDHGIEITINNEVIRVYFALCLIIADNLGINSILGLVECFRANYFCRICKMHREATECNVCERTALIRTEKDYESDLLRNDTVSTGIKQKCIWNELKSFSITDNISLDIMHDILEGVADYDMAFIIQSLVEANCFDYDELNDFVQCFYYGDQEFGNKPPLITKEHISNDESLKFSASEMLCLVRYFPLMVGHKVKEDSEAWKLFLLLREIVDLLFSPKFSKCDLPKLEELISEHHEMYIALSGRPLRPKYHNIVHAVRVIKAVGPLKPLSAMRWEAKYKEYRQAANATSCRKKISHTLAMKQSLKMCTRFLGKRGLVNRFSYSPFCEAVDVRHIDHYENFEHRLPPEELGSKWNVVKWVVINGTLYKPGMVVVISVSDFFPCFGVIEVISVTDDHQARFLTTELLTVSFNSHLHSYHVKDPVSWDCFTFVNQKDLITFCPAHKRLFCDGQSYVSLRYPV